MKRKGKIPGRYHKTLKEQVRENPRLAAVYVILRVLVVLALVAQVFNGNFENVFLCVLTLILFTIPSFIERTIRIDIPDTLEIIILLFIFAAEILGEIQAYYVQFPYWDTMLHTLNGFLCAAIGFSLLDILNRDERLAFKLSPVYLAVVAFCFSMTIGVLWEFFECFMDQMFLLDMQKDTIVHSIGSVMLDPAGGNTPVAIHDITDVIVVTADGAQHPLGLGGYLDIGILDTMKDLFVNFIGAVVGVTGANGVGKSTLVRAMAGLERATEGELRFDGAPLDARARRRRCSLVMQDVNHQLFSDSVRGECELSAGGFDAALDLEHLEACHPMALSGGQKQRLAVACALLAGREVLLLDEPTSGLDFGHMVEVSRLVKGLAERNICIVVVTHDCEFLSRSCDFAYELEAG